MNYYNDNEPYVCDWLENLILFGHLPNGIVDRRPIQEITPNDLKGFTQCHFFAGIGGWSLALKLAQWPETLPIWTGSCPCQPFSVAGKQKGFEDERDLWPAWFHLQKKCRPPVIFGEQVANATDWLSRVRSDLGGVEYAMGGMPIEAACAGAAQYRDRFWFVAERDNPEWRTEESRGNNDNRAYTKREKSNRHTPERGAGVLARDDGQQFRQLQTKSQKRIQELKTVARSGSNVLASKFRPRLEELQSQSENTIQKLPPGQRNRLLPLVLPPSLGWGEGWTESEFRARWFAATVACLPNGPQFIECPDGKYRRLPPPRVRWLGNGLPSRVAKLRALGNSIYPPVAAQFIRAYMDVRGL